MSRHAIIWAGIITLIAARSAVAQFAGRWQREAREYGWLTSYEAAKDEAKKVGKPIMLVFRCVP